MRNMPIKKLIKKEHGRLNSKGFTLFVALIVTSLLLAIAFSLSDIVLKQLVFSQSARESQIAFYAADSGAECALYWDRKDEFGSSTPYGAFATSTEPDGTGKFYDLYCGHGSLAGMGKIGGFDKALPYNGNGANVYEATTTFYIDFKDIVSPTDVSGQKTACARVTVSKWIDNSDPTVPIEHTTVDSRGYDAPMDGGEVGLLGSDPVTSQPTGPWGPAVCQINNDRIIERAIRVNY